MPLLSRYCDFFSVSCVVEDEEELLGEELLLGGVALEPPEADPEAEPDFGVSLEADPLIPAEELDEEPGLEGDEDVLPPLDGAELGEVALLEPEEPGAEELRLGSPLSQALSPNASATANASVESFMCSSVVGIQR